MQHERRRLCCALGATALLGWVGTARAEPMLPPEAAAVAQARLLGRATMRYFGLALYEARLWVGQRFDAQRYDEHALALELQYARALDGAAIAQRSLTEMRRIEAIGDARAQMLLGELARAIPSVASGDRLTGVRLPGEPTRFFHNGRLTAAVADPEFARLFFGIWLAPSTSAPALRRQLIGAQP